MYAWVVVFLHWLFQKRGADTARDQGRDIAKADERLDHLQAAVNSEDWRAFDRVRGDLEHQVQQLPPIAKPRVSTVLALVAGDGEAARGQVAEARASYRRALIEAQRLAQEPARECGLRALASLGVLVGEDDPQAGEQGEQGLERESEAAWPITRLRLAQAALSLARWHRANGRHAKADARLHQVMRIALEFPGEEAEMFGIQAAMDLARHLLVTSQLEEGCRWLQQAADRALPFTNPLARQLRAEALLLLGQQTPVDALDGDAKQRGWFRGAVESGTASDSGLGRVIAARAALDLAQLLGAAGEHREAAAAAREVPLLVGELPADVQGTLVDEAHSLAGQALLMAGEREGAADELRATMERGLASDDAGRRAIGRFAAFRLSALCCDLDRFEEADAILERLEEDAQTFAGEERVGLEARLARGRGYRAWRSNDRFAARHQLEQSLAILEALPESERAGAMHPAWRDLGMMALEDHRLEDAVRDLQRAVDSADAGEIGDAETASLWNALGLALQMHGRVDAAVQAWRRAFEAGRVSGETQGRVTAAAAAMNLAVHLHETEERLQWAEAARSLAKLSGAPGAETLVHDAEGFASMLRDEDGEGDGSEDPEDDDDRADGGDGADGDDADDDGDDEDDDDEDEAPGLA
jgi:tetratricopeptide (TPR) repeat protein